MNSNGNWEKSGPETRGEVVKLGKKYLKIKTDAYFEWLLKPV